MRLDDFLVSAQPQNNAFLYEAKRQALECNVSREFPPGLGLKRVYSGIFFRDTNFGGRYFSDLQKWYGGDVSHMEASRNGRHAIDYLRIEGIENQLDFWFDLLRNLEKNSKLLHGYTRVYMFSTYSHCDSDFHFRFFHIRDDGDGMSQVVHGEHAWFTPTYIFTVK